jgi:hypothetical protein
MGNKIYASMSENRVKTFRWLFYFSLIQLLACFAFPMIMFRMKNLLIIELLNALTVGMLFGLYFLAVNIYGLFIDKKRRSIYIAIIILISMWSIWTVITWRYIEHMRYLT